MNQFIPKEQLCAALSLMHQYLENKYFEILNICVKINDFSHIEYQIEQYAKETNTDLTLVRYFFHGNVPEIVVIKSIQEMYGIPSVKDMIIKNREHLPKEQKFEDVITLINHKNNTINFLKNKVSEYEETIKQFNFTLSQYHYNLETTKAELNRKIMNLTAMNKDVFFEPIQKPEPLNAPPGLMGLPPKKDDLVIPLPSFSDVYNIYNKSIWN